uniref:Uncharacterized protein n=1 Tax=Leersia perrieri TaxID=77586 RepID=A0A0D9WUP5_9ORYZ
MSFSRAVVMQSRRVLRSRRSFSTTGATNEEANVLKETEELKTKTKRTIVEDVEKAVDFLRDAQGYFSR